VSARDRWLPTLAMTAMTAVWGSTFFLIKDVLDTLPAADFLAVRFWVAAVVMLVLLRRQTAALDATARRRGVVLGVVYGVAQLLQTQGLATTPASVSGFVTGMYVVLTPVLAAVLLRQRTPTSTWLAVGLATVGLAVLSLRGLSAGTGELLTLAAAALYALHIVLLGRWSSSSTALGLSTVQMVVIALVCTVVAVPGGIELPSGTGAWVAVLYMALVAGAAALLVQTWAQAHMSATRAAIVMTTEPVFAALFAVLFGGEVLCPRVLVGGVLVLAAMYLVELAPRRGPVRSRALAADDPPAEALHHEP
jgi:drug/metabolite transporter (DMT)-like permease